MDEALNGRVASEKRGTGRPLILIHGLGGPQMWRALQPLLTGQFSVWTVHLPGFGNTPPLPGPLATAELARNIVSSLPFLTREPAVLVGTSYGGQLAMEIAAQERSVSALVLVSSTGVAPKHWIADTGAGWSVAATVIRNVLLRSGAFLERSSRRSFDDPGRRPDDLVEIFRREMADPGRRAAWTATLRNVLRKDPEFKRTLARIEAPALIVTGAGDRIVPPASAEALHALLPGSRLERVEHAGHSLPLEQPARLCELICGHAAG
jgi:pimeloyl-ACP methyl ester carboxylesterase